MENKKPENQPTPDFSEITRRRFLHYTAGSVVIGNSIKTPAMAAQFFSSSSAPIPEPHFPDQLHLFLWRNWELVNTSRMAKVLKTSEQNIVEVGSSMGLPPKPLLSENQLRRNYITVIRQNWHVIPDDQIIELLGWTREHFEFTLKEDDFLDYKLGRVKPDPKALTYQTPSAAAKQRAADIKRTLQDTFGDSLTQKGEPPFAFVEDLSRIQYPDYRPPTRGVSDKEVDLRGWNLVQPRDSSQDLQLAITQFVDYLNHTFHSNSRIVPSSGAKSISFRTDPGLSTVKQSYEIRVEPGQIHVIATDLAGFRHALYGLQDVMESGGGPFLPIGTDRGIRRLSPAFLYSYFALYGDPLLEKDIDPFPEGYLQKLGRIGVDGVWLQAILRNMAPSKIFPEFGDQWQTRLNRLNEMVVRAARYGVRVYLYMNEPRAMPYAFFARYPQVKGTHAQGDEQTFAMCTSVQMVREWISESLARIFREVPGLGGVFTISMSENLTNCFSRGKVEYCPRCSKRQGWEVVAELHQAFVDGVHSVNREAEIVAWDWGWGFDWVRNGADAEQVIKHLPKQVKLLSVSEWDVPVRRGGFETKVGEYSISAPGPGPRANRYWTVGRQAGIEPMAAVQLNNTCEISAVPYIPVANLIQKHLDDILKTGTTGLMLSWTHGGYPSPNLEIAKAYYNWPAPDGSAILRNVAARRYGSEGAVHVLRAWETFSKAFEEFPYGIRIYVIPTQHGPANLLRLKATGYPSGMILFPQDDWENWVKPYPPAIVQSQFEKMAAMWKPGLQELGKALALTPENQKKEALKDMGVAETCYIHFKSVANQLKFYFLRKGLQISANKREEANAMIRLAQEEVELARRLFVIARQDSRIGYEASNHYFYTPLDLAEKVLNCRQIIQELKALG